MASDRKNSKYTYRLNVYRQKNERQTAEELKNIYDRQYFKMLRGQILYKNACSRGIFFSVNESH